MNQSATAKYVKIAMIPLLLGILYCVLPSMQTKPASSVRESVTTEPSAIELAPISTSTGIVSKPLWPEMSLSDLDNTDPFDRRMLFPEPKPSNTAGDSNNNGDQVLVSAGGLPEKKDAHMVQAVFQSPSGIAALVGDRVVHIGDQLADGTLVLGITSEHLVLAPPPDKSVN